MQQFDRQYRFIAARKGQEGFEIGATSEEQPYALHISFTTEKADTETPNSTKISLWNLAPWQLEILNEKDCQVMLRAGYGSNLTLLFFGAITFVTTSMDNADVETEIEAVDGRIELRDTYVSLSYTGEINTRTIIKDIAREMGVAISFSYNAAFVDLPDGFAFVGSASDALSRACASSGLTWQIQNGVLQVKLSGDVMNREVYLLNADSGLIGFPKRITFSEKGGAEQTGWDISFLLNGAIGIGDYVRLESRLVQGYFRVRSITHNGDNLEGDWVSTARLVLLEEGASTATATVYSEVEMSADDDVSPYAAEEEERVF